MAADAAGRRGTGWPRPGAQGGVFGRGGITRGEVLLWGGYATIAARVAAGVRRVPLGQTDGRHALARLEPRLSRAVSVTEHRTLDDVGGACFRSDLAAMHHETQGTRLFRT